MYYNQAVGNNMNGVMCIPVIPGFRWMTQEDWELSLAWITWQVLGTSTLQSQSLFHKAKQKSTAPFKGTYFWFISSPEAASLCLALPHKCPYSFFAPFHPSWLSKPIPVISLVWFLFLPLLLLPIINEILFT